MSGPFPVSVLLACLLVAMVTASSTKQGQHLKSEDFKQHLHRDTPTSPTDADWPQRFDGQLRSGHPKSRVESDSAPRPASSDADWLQSFEGQLRPGHRQSREASDSVPRPASSDVIVQRLAQTVDQLSADVISLTNHVTVLATQNEALQGNITDLRHNNLALQRQLQQSTQTIQQQTTALEAVLVQFAAFRTAVDEASLQQNHSVWRIQQDLASLHSSLSITHSRQNSTHSKLLAHDVTLHDFQQRMTSVEGATNRNAQDTQILQDWRTNVTDDVSEMNVTQRQLISDVQDLEDRGRQASGVTSQLGSQLAQLQQTLVSATRSIAFYARLSETMKRPQSPIILDDVLTNEGDAYNATSGNFTVPVEGDYIFAATSVSSSTGSSQSPRIELMVDEDRKVLTDPIHPTLVAALRLRAGQRVWLRSLFTSRYGQGMYFTGCLIRPVIN